MPTPSPVTSFPTLTAMPVPVPTALPVTAPTAMPVPAPTAAPAMSVAPPSWRDAVLVAMGSGKTSAVVTVSQTAVSTTVGAQYADGLVVDKLRSVAYFTDQSSGVFKVSLTDGNVTKLYEVNGTPRGLDLDPGSEMLYWVESEDAAVRRAPTSGAGDVETVFSGVLEMRDVKLRFDQATGECDELYVSSALTNEIFRASCDGDDAELFTTGFNKVVGLYVDPSRSAVFWADSTEVHTANITSGAYIGMVANGFSGLSYLDLDLVNARLYAADSVAGIVWGVDLANHGQPEEIVSTSTPRGFGVEINTTMAVLQSRYVQYQGVDV